MPAERYYYPEILEVNQTINLKDQEYHHLINVMRTRLGDEIEVVNGKGQLAHGILDSLGKKNAILFLKSVYTAERETKRIILAQGIPRQNRLEFIIEKGTELGMTEIWLFPAVKSEKKDFSENQLERLHGLAISAMKQCGRLYLPKIVVMPPLKQWENFEELSIFYGDTNPDATPFVSLWKTLKPTDNALFCIGPESGFPEEEIATLHKFKAYGVKLHPHILRTDTAAISALALLTHQMFYNS